MTKFYQNSAELIIAYYTYFVNRQRINIFINCHKLNIRMHSRIQPRGGMCNTKQTALLAVLSIYNQFNICYNMLV